MDSPVLELENVTRIYAGTPPLAAVNGVSFSLAPGSFAALVGPSGSGKTSLLNLASGLDRPSSGKIRVAGTDVTSLSQTGLCKFRSRHIGFVFQSYSLFPVLTALENVEYTSVIRGDSTSEARRRATDALEKVGLKNKLGSKPGELSGGQQQRVAVARALATEPEIIFADEPTANLDTKTGLALIDLFIEINRQSKVTFLFSTHDPKLVDRLERKIEIRDGRLV